jgi:Ca2+-binding EF-hand superfamily protein
MKKIIPSLLLCLLTAISVHAQVQKSTVPDLDETSRKGDMARLAQKQSNDKFEAADEDKDGVLSRAEVTKNFPYIDQNFDRYDKNKDGVLSWDEYVGHDKWKRPAKEK